MGMISCHGCQVTWSAVALGVPHSVETTKHVFSNCGASTQEMRDGPPDELWEQNAPLLRHPS